MMQMELAREEQEEQREKEEEQEERKERGNKTIDKMKGQLTEWKNIFTNYTSDKRLISKIIYKEPIQLNTKTPQNLIKNGQRT